MNAKYCWQPSEGQSEISRLLLSLEQAQFFKLIFFSLHFRECVNILGFLIY